uniref:Transcription elongation factor 1 homolog n=1 Tax=Eptatretus burgeri TaxID=7764 RepID=A0A8C4WU48_EPTBU
MGRRKSKRKLPSKKKMIGTLETQFTCPFCNHERSCDVKMDRERNTGVISCSVCLEEFQTPITCILCICYDYYHLMFNINLLYPNSPESCAISLITCMVRHCQCQIWNKILT